MSYYRILHRTLLFLFCFLIAGPAAYATAMYDAASSGRLEITGIDYGAADPGLVFIEGFGIASPPFEDNLGNASSTSEGSSTVLSADPLDMIPGDSVEQSTHVFGEASLWGGTYSDMLTDGYITVFNDDPGSDITISFKFSYELTVDSSVMGPGEFAGAFADVSVFSDFDDYVDDFLESFSDFDLGISDGLITTGLIEVDFSLLIPAGFDDEVVVLMDADGVAAAIPEPATLALLAIALLSLLMYRTKTQSGGMRV
ncbi:MAG: PEP-CTERM sorting domain-containing protein [Gammaproteobacteria bacterium]|nr:PEP-CTERM sorting domain-containing protein [Gammaproteobacteria bacterium]